MKYEQSHPEIASQSKETASSASSDSLSKEMETIQLLPPDFKCQWDECEKNFGQHQFMDFSKHLQEHARQFDDEDGEFECRWYGCNLPEPFSERAALSKHVLSHCPEFKEKEEKEENKEKKEKKKKEKKEETNIFTCKWDECEKIFSDGILFSKHLQEHARQFDDEDGEFECRWYGCNLPEPFSERAALSKHVLSHCPESKEKEEKEEKEKEETNIFTCKWDECEKIFSDGILFSKHLQEHARQFDDEDGEFECRWYGCNLPEPFSERAALSKHVLTHSEPKQDSQSDSEESEDMSSDEYEDFEMGQSPEKENSPLKCEWGECQEQFPPKNYELLGNHLFKHLEEIRKNHSGFECRWFGCEREKGFGKFSSFSEHCIKHTKPKKELVPPKWTQEYVSMLKETPRSRKQGNPLDQGFSSYCTHQRDEELDKNVEEMLKKLSFYQQRLLKQNPTKAGMRKRICFGLGETQKLAKRGKALMVVLAPNMENSGPLMEIIQDIVENGKKFEFPVVFALSKRKLAKSVNKPTTVSAIGIMRNEGAFDEFKRIVTLIPSLKELVPKSLPPPTESIEEKKEKNE
eukprot:TRINITY_DN942_c0_g1_i2.p1 TRINITY_DN942_c0_g1~~TRINITY_DN942_c0_g1_i2.p1  ORF type:complete len:576 (+),score=213.87 TRINITY_DN942_c0_g1_i2:687-2414(+)